jgi:hypothetical protein
MKTAAVISFLMALVLLGLGIGGYMVENGTQASMERMNAEMHYLNSHSAYGDSQLAEMIANHHAETQTESFQAIGGVVFMIAGFALWSKRNQKGVDRT